MDDKSNVSQPTAQEQSGTREQQHRGRREQQDGVQVTDARAVGGGRGVNILGKGRRDGVVIENEEPTLETEVELGSLDHNERNLEGRREFRS